ncbi:MAG: sulfur carrier protein ThiS [Pseudomonadota bacterium]
MAKVLVNGLEENCNDGATILSLLEERGINPNTVVVERNRTIVKAEAFGAISLEQGDELEILQFVGGG